MADWLAAHVATAQSLVQTLASLAVLLLALMPGGGLAQRERPDSRPRPIIGGRFEASGVVGVPRTSGVLFVDDGEPDRVFWMTFDSAGRQEGPPVGIPLGVSVRAVAVQALKNGDIAIYFREEKHLSKDALDEINALRKQFDHALSDLLREGVKAGEELMSTLRGQPVASRQVLRVGALTTLSRNFQLEFLRPLVGRPDVELIVRSGNIRDLLAQLEAHAVDVVLANSAAPRDARSSLRNHLLNEQPVSLVGRPRAGKRKFRFPQDLVREPLLLPSLDSDIRVAFDRILELAGIRPTILAEVDDMAMLRLLAREREGVTLVPPIVVRDFATHLGLKPFKLISEMMEMGIFASMTQSIDETVASKIAEKHGFLLDIKHRGDAAAQQAAEAHVRQAAEISLQALAQEQG